MGKGRRPPKNQKAKKSRLLKKEWTLMWPPGLERRRQSG